MSNSRQFKNNLKRLRSFQGRENEIEEIWVEAHHRFETQLAVAALDAACANPVYANSGDDFSHRGESSKHQGRFILS